MKQILFLIITTVIYSICYCQQNDSTFNPAYLKYLNDLDSGKITNVAEDGHWCGFVPSPVNLDFERYYNNTNRSLLAPINNKSFPRYLI